MAKFVGTVPDIIPHYGDEINGYIWLSKHSTTDNLALIERGVAGVEGYVYLAQGDIANQRITVINGVLEPHSLTPGRWVFEYCFGINTPEFVIDIVNGDNQLPIPVFTEPLTLKGDKGDKGNKGDKGDKGDRGAVGPQGIQGEQGIQGIQGEQGEQGIQGIQGEQGEQGIQGNQGNPGVDASLGYMGGAFPVGQVVQVNAGNVTSNTRNPGFITMIPFYFPDPVTIDQIGVRNTNAATAQFNLSRWRRDEVTGNLVRVINYGTVIGSASADVLLMANVSDTIPRGIFYIGHLHLVAAAAVKTVVQFGSWFTPVYSVLDNSTPAWTATVDTTSLSALPDISYAGPPRIFMRRA